MVQRPSVLRRWAGRGLLVLLAGFLLGGALSAAEASSSSTNSPRDKTLMKRLWGVEVMYVRESAAGFMLEFRFRVVDASLAAPLFNRATKPVLIVERNGATFAVPAPGKVGELRNSETPENGQIYWMLFANPGNYVKPGEKVTVKIGDFLAEGLVVE